MQFVVPRLAFVAVIAVAVVIGIGGWALLYLPKATITVYPTTKKENITHALTLSSKVDAPDFKRFTVPAKLLDKTIEEQKIITREGANIHDDFAKGKVTLINDQDEEQPLLPKTNLRHEATGVFFLTDVAITIPPKNKVEITVTAKEKGANGNVPAGKFIVDKLPASLQQVVYAESKQAFAGGVATDKPVTQQEIDAAKQTVAAAAKQRLIGEMTAQAGGARIREDLLTVNTEDDSVSATAGSAAQTFTVSTKLHGRAFIADENDLLSMTVLALRTKADKDHELSTFDPASFSIKIQRSDFDRGEAYIEGTVSGMFATKIGLDVFSPDNLAGRSKSEVEEYFKQFPSVGKVEVKFSPVWVNTVPSRKGATEIVVKNPQ